MVIATIEDRLKHQIGELIFTNHALALQLEEAKAKIEELEKSMAPVKEE